MQARPDDKPPRMELAKLLKNVDAFMTRMGEVDLGSTAPLRAYRIALTTGEWVGLIEDDVGKLAKLVTSFAGDRPFTRRLLWRIGLFIMSNIDAMKNGIDVRARMDRTLKDDRWSIFQASSITPGGFSQNGRRMYVASFTELWGPSAGTDFSICSSAGYLAGIVRDISGARFSRTVDATDLSLMRIKAIVGKGERSMKFKHIDTEWASGRTWNSSIRRYREGCRRWPCERCGKTRAECPYSPKTEEEA